MSTMNNKIQKHLPCNSGPGVISHVHSKKKWVHICLLLDVQFIILSMNVSELAIHVIAVVHIAGGFKSQQ